MRKGEAKEALDEIGLDAICADVSDRKTLTAIAKAAKVSIGSLLSWIEADAERSARVRETRQAMARLWDEQAETEIRNARNDFGLRKAKELAHHYRWRASKVAPGDYGDKLQHSNDPENPLPAPQFIIQPVQPAPVREIEQ